MTCNSRRLLGWVAAALLFLAGCPREEPPPPPPSPASSDRPIRLLVIDDPQLAQAIERAWRANSEAPLEIAQRAPDALEARRLDADAVIYPSGLLGELAEAGLLLPLTEEMEAHPQLDRQDVLDMLRLREVRWGERVYAVAFGSPVLLLAYRQDVLDRLGAPPPQTWQEYQRLLGYLAREEAAGRAAPADRPQYATAEPWGPGWAAQMLLARAAPYVRHRDQYSDLFDFTTMKPLIDGPPYVRALEEMVAAVEHAAPESLDASPRDAYRQLAAGRTALALCWPWPAAAGSDEGRGAPASDAPAPQESEESPQDKAGPPQIRWTELPGSPDVYHQSAAQWEQRGVNEPPRVPLLAAAGRLGSVTRESSRSKAALQVLAVLAGEWSREVAPHSPAVTLYRESHLAAPDVWYPEGAEPEAAQSYAEAAHRALTRGVWMFSPRLPGRQRYLAALDGAVRRALAQEASPQEALREAAQAWEVITEELGRKQQIDAYERSLGLEP